MKVDDVVEIINDLKEDGTPKYKTKIGSYGVLKEIRPNNQFVIMFEYIAGDESMQCPVKLQISSFDCKLKGDVINPEDIKIKKGQHFKLRKDKNVYTFIDYNESSKRFIKCSYLMNPEKIKIVHIQSFDKRVVVGSTVAKKWICVKSKTAKEPFYWFKFKLDPEFKVKIMPQETKDLRLRLINEEKRYWELKLGLKLQAKLFNVGNSAHKAEYYISTTNTKNKVHAQAGCFLDINALKYMKTLEQIKVPTEKQANYVGVEIECYSDTNKDQLSKELIKEKLHTHVSLVGDGSINAPESKHPIEIRILFKEEERYDVMRRLGNVLNKTKAEANKSCGLHVHLDMRNRDPKKAWKNLFFSQPYMIASQPDHRQWNNYAMRCFSEDMEIERQISCKGRNGRYKAINPEAYAEHKSLEIRIHEGTTNHDDIIHWVDFLINIVEAEPMKTQKETVDNLFNEIKASEPVRKHLTKRIQMYAEQNSKVKFA